jgi:hypothetical protein
MKKYELYEVIDLHDYFGYDLTKEKNIIRLTKRISSLCRKTPEYDIWAKIKKRGYEKCPICGRAPELAKPEVHHDPTLFEVIYNTVTELINKNEILNYSPIQLVNLIMEKHLNDKISSQTICELCHKEIHNLRKLNGEIDDE